MQGDERSKKELKSTCGSIQNNELHQTMQTVTVQSELTGRVKKLNNLYKPVNFILMLT